MNIEDIIVYTCPKYKREMDAFYAAYELEVYLESPVAKIKHKPQKDRQCRFCGKKYPETRFAREAHLIPEFMGNKYLTSDSECDACNQKFSRYENDFKYYLGIIPSLTKTPAKGNKVPKFKAPRNELVAGITDKVEGGFVEILKGEHGDAIKVDYDNGVTRIEFRKHSYIPFNVYKAFLKMGLAALPKDEIMHYSNALSVLAYDEKMPNAIASVHVTNFPFSKRAQEPFLYVFKKRKHTDAIPAHVVILHYQNLIFQFFIPFYKFDGHVYKDMLRMPVCPPMFSEKVGDEFDPSFGIEDFTGLELKRNERQYITYNFDFPKGNLMKYDPVTGESWPVDTVPKDDLLGMILLPDGTTISLKENKKDHNTDQHE
ncbi:MAG: hypothetical protein JST82_13945 [Bacteroidetes bacterium]|nr:hypothetical protein [Bacteroidota bacterium]